MRGPIHRFLADDHLRLDALLRRATAALPSIAPDAYAAFRAGLLRHIAMEEKVLLPAAARLRGGEPLPIAAKLRVDHGAIAALLVPTPTAGVVAALRAVLDGHNELEEAPGGLYETCDGLADAEAGEIVERLTLVPQVRVAAHNDGPLVINATCRALARAGFDFEPDDLMASS